MPVDYSKWDNLELSDDSDIEVHPNVDKRSFIRAKQTQIHQQRVDRKHQIETLKYEKIINDGLLSRIDALLKSLREHKERAETGEESAEALVFKALMKSTGRPDQDSPPTPPPGVHAGYEQPSYSKMMAALVDQCKKAIDEANPTDRYPAFVTEITSHQTKVEDLQKQLLEKLAELQKEETSKITSESIHTGFDSSFVSKPKAVAPTQSSKSSATPELLNKPALHSTDSGQSSGADADIEDGSLITKAGVSLDSDDEDMQASPIAKKFAKIRFGDYRTSLDFISNNLDILSEKNTDGLLVEAFNGQTEHRDDYSRQCVHQALLLQYCRQLGKDGVQLFFKRITTPGHQAQKLFMDDVNSTYARIRSRCREIEEQSKRDEAEGGGVEQIQLHAVDPNTTINISVPPANDPDEDTQRARQIFEMFPPGLQRALESGSLDRVNEVLGKMSVDEAEEIVAMLGEGGMLSMEEGVIDGTTEEGKRQIEEIERTRQMPGQAGNPDLNRVVEEYEDPGMD